MRIIVENFKYPTSSLDNLINPKYTTVFDNNQSSVDYVGYYHNYNLKESVLILPKVFLQNEKIFNEFSPELLIKNNAIETLKTKKSKSEIDFVYNFSLLIYQSLREFHKRKPSSTIIEKDDLNIIKSNLPINENSELDITLSLLNFYKENQNLIRFIKKINQSNTNSKIHWPKTISKKLPLIKNQKPYYFNTFSIKKEINYDEELIIIFLSVLNKLKNEYGFKINIDSNYSILVGKKYDNFELKSLQYLKRIKYNYFSDKFVSLYKLLYIFFEKQQNSTIRKKTDEYILATNYNIIFEDMIDKILSLPEYNEEINNLKNQKDGKIVDHIFEFQSLMDDKDIFYIGDSKYYKDTTSFSSNTIYKQHTYAKNVIQFNINLFNENDLDEKIKYRDDLTEGYNITPNVFIQAFVPYDLKNIQHEFKFNINEVRNNFHYENRLFDRDTLRIHNFKINFLFVLKAYNTRNQHLYIYREQIYKSIRESLIEYYNGKYDFYFLEPNDNIKIFVNKHFKKLNGKIYRSYFNNVDNIKLVLALEKDFSEENECIKNEICLDCVSEKFRLQ